MYYDIRNTVYVNKDILPNSSEEKKNTDPKYTFVFSKVIHNSSVLGVQTYISRLHHLQIPYSNVNHFYSLRTFATKIGDCKYRNFSTLSILLYQFKYSLSVTNFFFFLFPSQTECC